MKVSPRLQITNTVIEASILPESRRPDATEPSLPQMVDWKPVLPDVPLPQVTFAKSSTAISLPPPTAVPQAALPPVRSADTDAPPIIDAQSVGYVVPPEPRYPPASRRAREEGEVLVRVLIGIDGRPNEVRILRSSGHARLDDAAIEAVRAALFRPYVADGRARAAYVRVPVEFALRPAEASRQQLADARPGCLAGRSPRSRDVAGLKRLPRTFCRSTPHRRRYRGIVAESSLQSAPRRLPVAARPARGPRDTRSKRRLADATVGSRAGAWTRWYPSREAALRPRSWTSRALLAKGCLDDSAIPLPSGVRRQHVRGTLFSAATILNRGKRLGIPPRPRGEQLRPGAATAAARTRRSSNPRQRRPGL